MTSQTDAARRLRATERLVEAAQELSLARSLESVMRIVRSAARELTGADGATFVLREGDLCHYADEDAIAPLWKGRRFPMESCISGWAMLHKRAAAIEDIYADPRIPADAYRPTFVQSLAMVPIRIAEPLGAIGNYWAKRHAPSEHELKVLQAMADLTSVAMENVELYAQLERRIAEAQEAVRARDEFLGVASHELRTPMTVVQLQLELISETLPASVAAEHGVEASLERANRGVQRLGALVDDLLEVSRIGRMGRLTPALEPLDLGEVVRAVLERLASAARRASCEVSIETEGELTGAWDRLRVEQLVTNLATNAFSHAGAGPVHVRVARVEGECELSVRDHGPGIAPEHVARIFDRFERAVSSRGQGGLGLGLYIARQIAEAHGGSIRVESEPGVGSVFTVRLPS